MGEKEENVYVVGAPGLIILEILNIYQEMKC
jgi:hypothetical protein